MWKQARHRRNGVSRGGGVEQRADVVLLVPEAGADAVGRDHRRVAEQEVAPDGGQVEAGRDREGDRREEPRIEVDDVAPTPVRDEVELEHPVDAERGQQGLHRALEAGGRWRGHRVGEEAAVARPHPACVHHDGAAELPVPHHAGDAADRSVEVALHQPPPAGKRAQGAAQLERIAGLANAMTHQRALGGPQLGAQRLDGDREVELEVGRPDLRRGEDAARRRGQSGFTGQAAQQRLVHGSVDHLGRVDGQADALGKGVPVPRQLHDGDVRRRQHQSDLPPDGHVHDRLDEAVDAASRIRDDVGAGTRP